MKRLGNKKLSNKKNSLCLNLKKTVFFLMIAGFMVSTIFLTVGTATSSSELVKLKEDESKLIEKRRELSEIIVSQSSLKTIEEESKLLGYTKPKEVIYVARKYFVAKLP